MNNIRTSTSLFPDMMAETSISDSVKMLLITSPLCSIGIRAAFAHSWPGCHIYPAVPMEPEQFADLAAIVRPQVTLLDSGQLAPLSLFKALGLERVRRLGMIVVLTAYPSEEELFQLAMWGAAAYLNAFITPEDLVATVRTVSQGIWMLDSQMLADPFLAAYRQREREHLVQVVREAETEPEPSIGPTPLPLLTSREQEILQLMAAGMSNKEIGRRVNLSASRVKGRVTTILAKLEVTDRTHAVVRGWQLGWITLPDIRKVPNIAKVS